MQSERSQSFLYGSPYSTASVVHRTGVKLDIVGRAKRVFLNTRVGSFYCVINPAFEDRYAAKNKMGFVWVLDVPGIINI